MKRARQEGRAGQTRAKATGKGKTKAKVKAKVKARAKAKTKTTTRARTKAKAKARIQVEARAPRAEARFRGNRLTAAPEAERPRLLAEIAAHPESGPALTGGDLDADWQRAASSGEEAVGGSVATPDQDVVDELGEALGVPQAPDAPVRTSEEILRERDRRYWALERRAAEGNAEDRTGRRVRDRGSR